MNKITLDIDTLIKAGKSVDDIYDDVYDTIAEAIAKAEEEEALKKEIKDREDEVREGLISLWELKTGKKADKETKAFMAEVVRSLDLVGTLF